MSRIIKHRLNPSKVMLALLYGSYSSIQNDGGLISMDIGPFARLLRVPNSRLKEYLTWLEKWEYLSNLKLNQTTAKFCIKQPRLWETYADKTQ